MTNKAVMDSHGDWWDVSRNEYGVEVRRLIIDPYPFDGYPAAPPSRWSRLLDLAVITLVVLIVCVLATALFLLGRALATGQAT